MTNRLLSYIVVMLTLVFLVTTVNAYKSMQANEERIAENSELACSIARLVSYVPAVQFEGEPTSNFINWIEARRDLLSIVQDGSHCSAETVEVLEHRVELDEELLKELQNP